jgi:hypothetical protein
VTPTLAVSIGGTAQEDQTLTASPTLTADDDDSAADVTYQWQRSADGSIWTAISGATAATYVAQEADENGHLRVRASFTNDTGQTAIATSDATAAVIDVTPTLALSIAPTAALTLAARASTNDSDASIGYQWQTSSNGTTWTNVAGAIGSTYNAVVNKQNYLLRVRATASDPDGDGTSAVSGAAMVGGTNGGGKVALSGSGNIVIGGSNNYTVSGGTDDNVIFLGGGNDTVSLSGNDNTVTLGNGNEKVSVGGTGNKVTVGTGGSTLTAGPAGGSDTFILNGSKASLTLQGTGNMVFVNGGTDTITDTLSGSDQLDLVIGASGGVVSIKFFSAAHGIVDLAPSLAASLGWTTPTQVANALRTDTHAGSLLSLGTHGSIDFLKIPLAGSGHLTAANFQIG